MQSRIGLSCGIVVLAVCSIAHGQDRLEPTVTNPGARSLGLGGAFVALADDATAAYANPAGLVQLVRPEISVEASVRSFHQDHSRTTLSGVGFGSFVLPLKRWSLAVYGHTLADIELPGGWGEPVTVLSDLMVVNAGLSAGLKASESVSVGFGLTHMVGSFTGVWLIPGQFPDFVAIDSTSTRTGLIGGVLWSINDAWAVGLAHRSGADFEFDGASASDVPATARLSRVTAAGARWRSAGGQATVAVEVEQLSGSGDRTRIHLGGEWAFLASSPMLGLRAGLWRDPGVGARSSDVGGLVPFDDVMHASAGGGLAFRKVQLDLGVDVSDVATTASLSAIFSF